MGYALTKESSDAEILIAEKELCKHDLKYLCSRVLGMNDWDKCHDELESFLKASTKKKKLILVPRGHLKTSVVTIGLSIQKILQVPDCKVLLANAVWDNARSFLSEIKQYLENKSSLPQTFGKFQVSTGWNQDEITTAHRNRPNKTPTYSTAGVDSALASQHYDYIFADDLVNRQTVSTADQIEKTIKYFSDLQDLLEPDGELYIIGTRWDDNDLYGYIIENFKDEFDIYVKGATDTGEIIGNVTFPKKFSIEKLTELLKLKGTYEFFSQYFNNPVSKDSCHFKPPNRYWTEVPIDYVRTITVDPAIGEKTKDDDTVITMCARSPGGALYVEDYISGHFSLYETVENIFKMVQRVPYDGYVDVGIEAVAYQKALVQMFTAEVAKRRVRCNVKELRPHKDKFTRIMALQPLWEQGNLLLKQGMVELESEMLRFPRSHDDHLDTLAMQLAMDIGLSVRKVNSQQSVHPRFVRGTKEYRQFQEDMA